MTPVCCRHFSPFAPAGKSGAVLRTVSLGNDVLFASHTIVIMHHYLDKILHSCVVKPPRQYAAKRTSWNNWKR